MHLFTLIIGIWLLPRGDTLKCYTCVPETPGNCTEAECPSESHHCVVSKSVYSGVGLKPQDYSLKTCVPPESCEKASVNFGAFQILSNTQCCNSNLCNSNLCNSNLCYFQPVQEPSTHSPNGKLCFSGADLTREGKILPCEGTENFCITVTVATGIPTTLKGCASKLACSSLDSFAPNFTGADVTCCEGNLCNSGITTSAGLQLVAVAMVSLALLS